MRFDDPSIGLPPSEDDLRREPTSADMWKARGLNLFGLVSPVSNIGMVFWSPAEIRWVGVGAGIICWAAMFYGWHFGHEMLAWIALCVCYLMVVLGLIHPKLPEIPARAWVAFGLLLGKVMSVPIFALLYFVAVTPTALLVRLFGKDPLKRNAPAQETYWIEHEPQSHERYERQF
jgi:saxitoxin biosynthesis operon SxtJ-like protein